MNCLTPVGHVKTFECGRCAPCLRYRRRVWTHRLILEAKQNACNTFVTLTYSQDNLPRGNTLEPLHVQNWLKELRHAIEPQRIRFFLSGEYGEQTQRPHYHALLFGLNPILAGGMDGNGGLVNKTWGMGHTSATPVSFNRIAYVAGYVDKKIDGKEPKRDPRNKKFYIDGRYGQFTRMSLRKGIGYSTAPTIARLLQQGNAGTNYIQTNGDVPTALRHGKILLPLGRYLRGKIRDEVSNGVATPQKGEIRQTLSGLLAFDRMQVLREVDALTAKDQKKSIQKIMLDRIQQTNKNISAREAIHKSKGQI